MIDCFMQDAPEEAVKKLPSPLVLSILFAKQMRE